MYHLVAHALPGRLLFRTWEEGLHLYNLILTLFPEALAVVVMPDHIHILLPHPDKTKRLRNVMSAHAQWIAHRRGDSAGVLLWSPAPLPEAVTDELKERRNVRYVHLNPCRSKLASDPLAWPLSTHRDHVGLGSHVFSAPKEGASAFHRHISADPSVNVNGTELPHIRYETFDLFAIRDAVSAVLRWPILSPPTPRVRKVFVATAAAHELLDGGRVSLTAVGDMLGVVRSQVHRLREGSPHRGQKIDDPVLAAAIRVVGDPRFGPITGEDLMKNYDWRRYRNLR